MNIEQDRREVRREEKCKRSGQGSSLSVAKHGKDFLIYNHKCD